MSRYDDLLIKNTSFARIQNTNPQHSDVRKIGGGGWCLHLNNRDSESVFKLTDHALCEIEMTAEFSKAFQILWQSRNIQ